LDRSPRAGGRSLNGGNRRALRWLQFYGNPATEHLFVVVTREPLADVPIAETLMTLCSTNKENCPWHPSVDVWTRIQQAAKADVKVVCQQHRRPGAE